MPSKGGRRASTTVAGSIGADATATAGTPWATSTTTAFTFSAAELARPLHRGLEVERFNELARRQEELAGEESNQLYLYRLRRLQTRLRRLDRVCITDDEEAIREALDDLDGRLRELRRFEESRQVAGLPTGHEVDLSTREAAIERLLELSGRRPSGLIAGSDTAPEHPAGGIRLSEIAIQPSAEDAPVYILAPLSIPSDALARNVEVVVSEGAQVRLVHAEGEIPRGGDRPPLVLNWGGSQPLPDDLVTLNRPEAVRIASDQVESLRRLGDLAPKTVARPNDIGLIRTQWVVAKRRHGTRGSGKAVIGPDADRGELVRYDLFQELVPRHREYRISLLNGRVVSAYLKQPPEGAPADDLRPNWSFERTDVLPRAVVSAAREAGHRIGLDYAGVDVIEDPRGRAYCLEANAAPGMSVDTLRNLYAHLQQIVQRGLTESS